MTFPGTVDRHLLIASPTPTALRHPATHIVSEVYRCFPESHFPGMTFPGTALSRNVTPTPPWQTSPSSPLLSVVGPARGRQNATTSATSSATSTTAASVHRRWRCWSTAGRHATTTSAASTTTAATSWSSDQQLWRRRSGLSWRRRRDILWQRRSGNRLCGRATYRETSVNLRPTHHVGGVVA